MSFSFDSDLNPDSRSFDSESFASSDLSLELHPVLKTSHEYKEHQESTLPDYNQLERSLRMEYQERINLLEEGLCAAQTRARLTDGQLDRIKDRLGAVIDHLRSRLQQEKEVASTLHTMMEQIQAEKADSQKQAEVFSQIYSWLERIQTEETSADTTLSDLVSLLKQANSYQYLIAIASQSQPHQSFSACSPPHLNSNLNTSTLAQPDASSWVTTEKEASLKTKDKGQDEREEKQSKWTEKLSAESLLEPSSPTSSRCSSSNSVSGDMGLIGMLDWLAQSLLSGLVTLLRVGTEWLHSLVRGNKSSENEETSYTSPPENGGLWRWIWSVI